jgi:hypothetical protein
MLSFLALGLFAGTTMGQLAGNAQLTSTPGGGQYQDTIVLHNTGTTTVGTFWFGWIPGENFLQSMPTNVTAPPGWTSQVFVFGGPTYSIEWYATSSGSYVPGGGQLSGFGFTSADSSTVLQGLAPNDQQHHVTDSYLYITGAFGDPGLAFTVGVTTGSHCGTADFNCDGSIGTDADIESFFACLSGTCPPPPCTSSADFNGDGAIGTDADIEAFFRVLAGGPC